MEKFPRHAIFLDSVPSRHLWHLPVVLKQLVNEERHNSHKEIHCLNHSQAKPESETATCLKKEKKFSPRIKASSKLNSIQVMCIFDASPLKEVY